MPGVDLLVIGGSGFIGAHVVAKAIEAGQDVAYTYASRKLSSPAQAYQVKIEEDGVLETCIAETWPKAILYCAVPQPRSDAPHYIVSVLGVQRVAACLKSLKKKALLVYLSSNAVFSGKKGPYKESAKPDPEERQDSYHLYALTKFAGERTALSDWNNTIVVRTSSVDGRDVAGRINPRLSSMVERLQAKQPVPRFDDRYISPTLVDNLADALIEIMDPSFKHRGLIHISGSERLTDYEYARYLVRRLGLDEKLVAQDSLASSSFQYQRPLDMSLDTALARQMLKTRLLGVAEQLGRIFPD